ncbi:MAG: helix-turn-helix transcriptional regulator [Clostridia bacterium]|nr:helix-turn-helix transcriptional regulator [Clostridia bacterium]
MLYHYIGKRIRAHRILRQMTQEQLAEASNISISFLGHIERGTRKLSVETLYKIAKALDCSANDLLGLSYRDEQKKAAELLMLASQLSEITDLVPPKKKT